MIPDQPGGSLADAIVRTIDQPLLVLDGHLRVETASPAFYRAFALSPEETVGRRIHELADGKWDIPGLREVLAPVLPNDRSVEGFRVDEHDLGRIGRRALLINARRLAGRESDGQILVAIDDITERERDRLELEAQKQFAEKIIDASRDALLILGWDLRVKAANATFYSTFGVSRGETEGCLVYELGNGQWDIPRLRELLEQVLPERETFDDFEVEHDFEDIGHRVMILNARRIDHMQLILLAIEDVTDRRRSADQLAESEARLRSALAVETVAVLFWGSDFRLTDINDAFLSMTGFSRKEAIGLTWQELTPPEFHPASERAVAELAETGELAPYEKQYFRKDGSRWWGLFAGRRINGGAVEFVLDITDRKLAEEALRESEERYRLIVDSARDYAIFTTDPDGVIDGWPPGAEAVFGWTAEEAIGSPIEMTYTDEDRARGVPQKERTTARQQGVAANNRWHVRKDGSRVFINGSQRTLRNGRNELRGFLKIGQDLTRSRETEQALVESERRLRALVEGIPQLVWRAVTSGHCIWSSPQWSAYTGMSEEATLGRGWLEAVHPDDREGVMASWSRAEITGEVTIEYRLFHAAENRYRFFQARATPVRNDEGRIVEWLGASTDIDDLVRLQERQQVLLAELQHRTRNLLAVVHSIANQTVQTSPDLRTFSRSFNQRLGALSRAQGLLSRKDGEDTTIGTLVRMELDALGADLAREQVTLRGPQVPLRNLAVQTLSLALHELATNARKYGVLAGGGGHLTVTWDVHHRSGGERRLVLEWIEQGTSIPPKVREEPRSGYGRKLIERALPYSLGARTEYRLDADGIRCIIELPLSNGLEQEHN